MTPLRRSLLAATAALAAVLAVHGRSLPHDFVYDDGWTIVRNRALRDAGPLRFFTDASTAAAPASGMGGTIYRPLPTLTFAANLRVAGLRPWAWRAPDLLLHALNGWLLFMLLTGVLGLSAGAAALGAGLFLLHPVQVESAVWVTQRSNLMCAAAGLGALILLARGSAWGLAAYAAALLSKETAVTLLPFAALAAWRSGADDHRKKALVAGAAALAAGLLALRAAVVGGLAQRPWREGLWENLLVGQASWLEYLKLIAWPFRLTASHFQYVGNPWEHPAPWLGIVLSAAWAAATVLLWRRGARRAAAAAAWVPVTLSPHLGLVPLDTFVAERFLYLPLAGAATLVASAFGPFIKERAWAAGAGLLLLGAAGRSFHRAADWRDDLSLWRAAVRAEPGNPFSRLCLAEALHAHSRFAEAAQATREALALNPSAPLAAAGLNNLAELSLKEGRPGAALRFAGAALRGDPDFPPAILNRARALETLKRNAPAEGAPRARRQ